MWYPMTLRHRSRLPKARRRCLTCSLWTRWPVCWTRSPSRRIGLNPKAWRTCPTIPRCCATRRCWNSCTPPEPACRKRAARIEGERAHRTTRVVPQQARQTTVKAIGVGDHPCGRGTRAYRQAPASAHIAPFLRHASDPRRGRRAHRAGTAGSRERHHHADLHACKPGEPHRDISDLASKGKIA